MTRARHAVRPTIAGLTGLLVAVAGAVAAATPSSAAPVVSAQPEVEWDHQSCATHGAPARVVEVDSNGTSSESWTYWVDGRPLGTVRLLPTRGGPYRFALPPVPPGEHRWQVTTAWDEAPAPPGQLITTPECPDDPELPPTPSPEDPPDPGFTLLELREPSCRIDESGTPRPALGYSYLNGDSRGGTLEVLVDGAATESYVVPGKGGRLGTLELTPGEHTVTMRVAGQAGGKTERITVPDCSADLAVTPAADVLAPGSALSVRTKGAAPGEALRLRLSGVTIAEGVADDSGAATLRGTVPATFGAMNNRTVQVRGASATRTGTAHVSTVLPKTLRPTVWKSTLPRGASQRVTVTGLAPKERAVVIYGGRWISPSGAVADARGRYTLTFAPDARPGRTTVTVRGLDDTRRGSTTFTLR